MSRSNIVKGSFDINVGIILSAGGKIQIALLWGYAPSRPVTLPKTLGYLVEAHPPLPQ